MEYYSAIEKRWIYAFNNNMDETWGNSAVQYKSESYQGNFLISVA